MNRTNLKKVMIAGLAVFCIMLNGTAQDISQVTGNSPNRPEITANIKALIEKTLQQPFKSLNTDWFGTIQAEAILRWTKKGYPEGTQYVENWLNYHIEHDNKLSDEEYLNTYSGNKARIIREGVLPFSQIADGLVARQGPNGGLHVWVDDPASPEEVTSTAMTAGCIQEAMDKGWIPANYNNYVQKAWQFISGCVSEDGRIKNAYTGWAIPAEQKLLQMDEAYLGFIPGMVLLAAAQILN